MRKSATTEAENSTVENDIFQVSINSKKLMLILKKLEDNYSKLHTKIDNIDDYYKQGDAALNKKILSLEQNMRILIRNESEHTKNAIQTDFKKSQEKYLTEFHQKQTKLNELKYCLQTLNDKISKVNLSLTQQIQNSIRNYSMENFALKRNLQKTQQFIESGFEEVEEKILSFKNDIKDSKEDIFELQVKLKKYTDIAFRPEDADRIPMPQKKFEESINAQKYSRFLENQNNQTERAKNENHQFPKEKQRSRSKRAVKKSIFGKTSPIAKTRMFKQGQMELKQPTQNYTSILQYASISAKVQNLQKAINQKVQANGGQQKVNRLRKGTNTNMMRTFSYSKEDSFTDERSRQDQMDPCEIVQRIFRKLQGIERSIQAKQVKLSSTIDQMKEKSIMTSEKMEFLKQRIGKVNSEIAQIKIKLLPVNTKNVQTVDSASIPNLQSQLGKIIQRLDKQSQVKLNAEEFEKEKVKIYQKFSLIQQNLAEKAEKIDVKRAITFLEDKIKEIIFLVANEYNAQKMGAISKQPVKCLTCDKDVSAVEKNANQNGFKGMTASKSSRDIVQKYNKRLLKQHKENRPSTNMRLNYTTVTQLTENYD